MNKKGIIAAAIVLVLQLALMPVYANDYSATMEKDGLDVELNSYDTDSTTFYGQCLAIEYKWKALAAEEDVMDIDDWLGDGDLCIVKVDDDFLRITIMNKD